MTAVIGATEHEGSMQFFSGGIVGAAAFGGIVGMLLTTLMALESSAS